MSFLLPLLMGLAGFGLYLLYDINSFAWELRALKAGFFLGTLCIAAATVLLFARAWSEGAFAGAADILLLVLAALALAALVYCLFFALPFEETYAKQENGREVYTHGVYALCRHPGILCFFALYLFAGLAALPSPGVLGCGMIFSALNLGYALFQDVVTFPRVFIGYEEYRGKAPFVIPNKKSIIRAKRTWHRAHGKEENL